MTYVLRTNYSRIQWAIFSHRYRIISTSLRASDNNRRQKNHIVFGLVYNHITKETTKARTYIIIRQWYDKMHSFNAVSGMVLSLS